MSDPLEALLLSLADDELILGHRLSEWTGWVPYVEEDLALSSIAQDEIGHARVLYEIYCGARSGTDPDRVALGREIAQYRHAILCERPNRDFAFTVARHFLYEVADAVRLDALQSSSFEPLAQYANVARIEERFHFDHARTWIRRLGAGPVEARGKLAAALDDAFREAPFLFEPLEGEEALLEGKTMPRSSDEMRRDWLARTQELLAEVELDHLIGTTDFAVPAEMVPTASGEAPASRHEFGGGSDAAAGAGGRGGRHTEDFEPLWRELTGLYRAHPGARW